MSFKEQLPSKQPFPELHSRFEREHVDMFSPETLHSMSAVLHAAEQISEIEIANLGENKKSGINDFVTAWDIKGQEIIENEIHSIFPDDPILGEESAELVGSPSTFKRIWVIDPIDGTANARAGRRFSFISIGFAERGKSTSGVIYDPYHDELFYAEKGKGAWKNGKRIHASEISDPSKAQINTDMGFINPVSDLHQMILTAYGSPSRRMMGSAIGEMVEVATGTADIFFYTCIKPWDNAAVFCLLQEAGAIIRGTDGREIDFSSMDVVVGNPILVQDFIGRVGKRFSEEVKQVQQVFLEKNPQLKNVVSGI